MRSWRNWQTRKTKDLVGNSMQVQFLSTAPKSGKNGLKWLVFALFYAIFTMSSSEIWGIFGAAFACLRGICEIKSPRIEFFALFQEVFFG